MKVLRLHTDELPQFKRPVITIGAFDGFHLGHREIVNRVCNIAKAQNSDSVLITFDPHPRKILDQDNSQKYLLNSTEEKIALMSESELDYLILVPFSIEFSQMVAEEYVENFLIRFFQPETLVIGFDHRFGMNSEGDVRLLKKFSDQGKFRLVEISRQEMEEDKISSTAIRNHILNNDLQAASKLLGRPYPLYGKVVRGQQVGSQIGYPTANITPSDPSKLLPNPGVYAAILHKDGMEYNGLLYIGNRPTLGAQLSQTIEIHIKDFNENIYNQNVFIDIIEFIRPDQKFEDLKALKDQISRDDQAIGFALERHRILNTGKKKNPLVAVVILNYNGEKFIMDYLPSVFENLPQNCQLYLIDNASTDQSLLLVSQKYPEIKRIKLAKNYGFAEGYNKGLSQINADYFLLINSDIRVEGDWISPLIRRMQSHPMIMACQPKILSASNPAQFEYAGAAGGAIDLLGYTFSRGRMMHEVEKDLGQYNDARRIFWASGAALMVNAAMYKAMGGFDPDYFAHQEEIDLCWRIQRAGGEIWFEPESKAYHLGGGTLEYTNPRKVFLNFRNNLATIFKNAPIWFLIIILPLRLLLDMMISIRYLLSGKFALTLKVIEAYVISILSTPYLLHKKDLGEQTVERYRIGPEKLNGVLRGSLFVHYYLFRHTKYSDIPKHYLD